MDGKPQNRLQEVSADEIGCLIQGVAHYCGILPTGSNTTTERNMPVRLRSLYGHPAGHVLASSGKNNLDSVHHRHQLLGSLSGAGERAGFYREEENRAPAKEQLEKP
ncbi:uncharacterized protein LOC119558648 isoform X1 [Drosophila subpulchrella]|uniref:uncharacterized protein LOC119558648 isoform X1 n=1 Tax=Drosophila subpulchrella TaxID=1486046 RepID=UPI0018A1773D|nr:uncharacterized protein LOC119558648 isoform X1 [Drosophila subpulchrella]